MYQWEDYVKLTKNKKYAFCIGVLLFVCLCVLHTVKYRSSLGIHFGHSSDGHISSGIVLVYI